MFKQFIDTVSGSQVYLITSLWIFLVFFIVVTIMLIKMSKNHIEYMSELPLNDNDQEI
jgi:cbb3-type cytochrome oxidase subunit 3